MPIIDPPLWNAVQAQLTGHGVNRKLAARTGPPSLLAGLLFDHDGNRMTPSHAVKNGMRYRYYVSRPLITKDQTGSATGLRIPAAGIEPLVTRRLRRWLLDPGSVYRATQLLDPSAQRRLVVGAAEIGKSWPSCPEHASVPSSPLAR